MFAPGGATTSNVPVNTIGDSIGEGDETFVLQIDSVSPPATAGTPSQTVITIDDDESKLIVWYVMREREVLHSCQYNIQVKQIRRELPLVNCIVQVFIPDRKC